MSELTIRIYTSGDTLPAGLSDDNFFHSPQLFSICRLTPRMRPYMVVAEAPDGTVHAQMLAVVRYRSSLLPPYLYRHCRILGEGVTHPAATEQPAVLFGMMLQRLTSKLGRRVLYMEVSNLTQKMFGYRQLRQGRYFPVRWMSIHNSLHSRTPEERITPKMQRRIDRAYAHGVVTDTVQTDADFEAFSKLLRQHNWLKPKRYIPSDDFFRAIRERGNGQLGLTRYHGHVIGCSAVVFSQRQAYLWYCAFRRKSYAWLHPDILTIWHAIKSAHSEGYEHIYFMDVGLPFRRNRFRDFILRFGGKPTSTYRWFHCAITWVNRLLSWAYRD